MESLEKYLKESQEECLVEFRKEFQENSWDEASQGISSHFQRFWGVSHAFMGVSESFRGFKGTDKGLLDVFHGVSGGFIGVPVVFMGLNGFQRNLRSSMGQAMEIPTNLWVSQEFLEPPGDFMSF